MSDQRPTVADRLHVLVADDDRLFVTLATSSLKTAGFRVRSVHDGAEALQALQDDVFDLALVDLSMPRIDGFRLIAWIRATPDLRNLPIVVLSARNDIAAIEEAYGLGADAYQTKPINWALLTTHLRHVVRQSRTLAELRAEVLALRVRTSN